MELSKIKTLYETGCLTAKGVIFLAGENGVFGFDDLKKHFGISKAGYYRGLKLLEQDGLMTMKHVPGWTFRKELSGKILVDRSRHYDVTIASI
jgi:hypothetical protein